MKTSFLRLASDLSSLGIRKGDLLVVHYLKK